MLLTFLAAVFIVLPCPASGPAFPAPSPAQSPFRVGERLTYNLSWGALSVGTAVLEIAERQTFLGRPVVKLIHTARSNDYVSLIYPVNNRVESLLDEVGTYPYHLFFKRREGKRKNDIEVVFDQAAHKATFTKDGRSETVDIPPRVQDSLSCLYFFRTLPATAIGSSTSIDVHHDKKNYHLELRVEGTEHIKGPTGEFDTIRVLAIMPYKGLFLNEGNVRVWLTNDVARVPVLMKAKVTIGSVTATLTSIEGAAVLARP